MADVPPYDPNRRFAPQPGNESDAGADGPVPPVPGPDYMPNPWTTPAPTGQPNPPGQPLPHGASGPIEGPDDGPAPTPGSVSAPLFDEPSPWGGSPQDPPPWNDGSEDATWAGGPGQAPPPAWSEPAQPMAPYQQPPTRRRSRGLLIGAFVGVGALCLGGGWLLGGATSSEASSEKTPAPTSTTATSVVGTGPTSNGATPAGNGPVQQYHAPAWADPVVVTGKLVGSFEADGFTMDVYRLAQVTVKDDSNRTDPTGVENFRGSGKNKVAAGDRVDVYSCVITNTSSGTISMTGAHVRVKFHYDDTDEYDTLTNYSLEKKYRIETYLGSPGDGKTANLARGESLAVGAFVPNRPGDIFNVETTIMLASKSGKYPYDTRVGALHIIVE